MANRDLPQLDDLEVLTRSHNKVTYASFGTFNFDGAWAALKRAGATSCSRLFLCFCVCVCASNGSPDLVPNAENDCLEVDVFFGESEEESTDGTAKDGTAPAKQQQSKPEREFASWQYVLAFSCLAGATAVAAQGVLI